MSSPQKKLKLTPRKHQSRNKSGSRERRAALSQESKITSTPQHKQSSQDVISPNLSRIDTSSSSSNTSSRFIFGLDEGSQELHSGDASYDSTTVVRSSEAERSGIVPDEDYDSYFDGLGKIKYTGRIWQLYKPINKDTIYAQVLENPQNAQETVLEYILLYTNTPEVAVCKLLQLCVDVCGLQKLDIATNYNFDENAASQSIKLMESDRVIRENKISENGRYLFMEPRTHLAKALTMGIYGFIQKLILYTNERNVLYDEYFAKHFFGFIKSMSLSEVLPIRHTGVIFAIKVLTAVVMVYSNIITTEHSPENAMEADTSPENNFAIQKQDVNNFLEFFYFIFITNCHIQDKKLALMRVECIHELRIWIRYFPRIFISQLEAMKYLLKLLVDVSAPVRLAALDTCEALVETPQTLKILKTTLPDFTEPIGKRFYDVDLKVAVKAIDIFRTVLKHEESLITTHRFSLLLKLVFDKYFLIGAAAARFLCYYFKKKDRARDRILIQLAKFSVQSGDSKRELLVEVCLYQSDVIRDWKLYFEILLRGDLEMDLEKQALVGLFSEAVCQILTGKSIRMGELSRQVKNVDPEEHIKIARYMGLFKILLDKYSRYPLVSLEFLKIILVIDAEVLNENCQKACNELCDVMASLAERYDDENLLGKIAEVLHFFSGIRNVSRYANHTITGMCAKYAAELTTQLSQKQQLDTDVSGKVAIFFKYFDMTGSLTWELIFDSWGEVTAGTTIHLLYCCKWYLIWNLRHLTRTMKPLKPETAKQVPVIIRLCKEFISTCFNMLNSQDQPLQLKAYDCLCELHIKYLQELEEPIRHVKLLERLKLVIHDKQLQDLLVSVLEKSVITNAEMPRLQKQEYVLQYINLVHINAMPTECLGSIFKYYYAYNADYAAIFERTLGFLAEAEDENIFYMLIIHTLTLVYESILNRYGVVDLTTEGVKDLKRLVKQFLIMKEFRVPKKGFKKLLMFACKYSLKDESKYAFLYFTKYFIELIVDDDDKRDVLQFLKQAIPRRAEKSDAVLCMAKYLKDFKPASSKKKTKPKSASDVNHDNKAPTAKGGRKRKTPKAKGSKAPRSVNTGSETEVSEDDLTIHDSENDDLDETLTRLRI